jgi:LPXTG-motif cell wall-anchored protein
MPFALWLLQEATETPADNTNTIRIIAGILAIVCVVVIVLRRKKKASKEDWS